MNKIRINNDIYDFFDSAINSPDKEERIKALKDIQKALQFCQVMIDKKMIEEGI